MNHAVHTRGEFFMQKTFFFSSGRRIFLLCLFVLPSLFLCVHVLSSSAQERFPSDELKIEIIKIKDSGASPFWSPDGKEIVYVDKGGLFVISSSGVGKERKIVNGPVRLPRWSPDGKYIAYVDRKGLEIISPHAPAQPRLVYPDNKVQMPMWSPDSKWITFYLSELQGDQGSGVYAVNITTLKSTQLSYTGINPCWGNNGKSVFYFTPLEKKPHPGLLTGFTDDNKDRGFGQLFLADLDNSDTKKLTPIGGVCMNFNLDGNFLAFAPKRNDGTSLGIYLASPFKDDEPVKLSDDGYFPSFSFDDRLVSFFKFDQKANNTRIYITRLNYKSDLPTGGELIEVGKGIYPRWAFNKKELVYEMMGVNGGIYVAKISE